MNLMNQTLIVIQKSPQGHLKKWKLSPTQGLQTLGLNKSNHLISIDHHISAFELAFEFKNNKWSFIQLNVMDHSQSETPIHHEMNLQIKNSFFSFYIYSPSTLNLLSPHVFNSNSLTENTTSPSLNSKIAQQQLSFLVLKYQRNELRSLQCLQSLQKTPFSHLITQNLPTDWIKYESAEALYFVKALYLNDPHELIEMPLLKSFDQESKNLLVATLGSLTLFLGIGLFYPQQKSDQILVQNLIKKESQIVQMKFEKKQKMKSQSSPDVRAESIPSQKQQQKSNPASIASPKEVTKSRVKLALGSRISQLLSKVSATEARTQNIIVTKNGVAAGSAPSGRALAALGSVNSEGKNWKGSSGQGQFQGVSTQGLGGGGDGKNLGGSLNQGKTGRGGLSLIEEDSEVVGGLDREVIAQYIKTQLGQILYCYERQLSASPDLYGKVSVKFTISGQGLVDSQIISQTTLKNSSVEGCILNKVSRWKFPEPKGGTKVVVTYPFLFKSTQ